jgi:hypothetical protein
VALFDWTSEKQADVYTAAASRKRMAADTAKLITSAEGNQPRTAEVPTWDIVTPKQQ